ncbi:hypothetical protein K437DRAFT_278698 [Tilletiaria anomala UBC 951]|uniref:Pirin n=1 Tax=Tilletiaria anomala (strain ATCC 24038 / CBS 436.72 / UBC 951) TaxID=1037660 RepID=A0A066VQF1_TILAU|nr:uncharacterized protein K437DRAFT_278698 [Tilletiaria anomala UBC 951]KDN43957.1 hypothetical protein K437DRAFT_278698 [Tilletiaria anomala UBC 951]
MSAAALRATFISRSVATKVRSIKTREGDGALVRRSIGTPALRNLSPFLMLDHFDIAQGAGFPDHPHRGQTTVTLMMSGYVQHEDFKGHAGLIGPGDMQWMTAGKGIMHAEMPLHQDPKTGEALPAPIGLQLWIDLPASSKFTEPTYQELKATQIPTAKPRSAEIVDPEEEGSGWEVKVIAGKSHGVESPVRSPANGECWYFDVKLAPGGKIFQPLPTGWNAFLYTLPGGNITIGSNAAASSGEEYQPYHTLVLSNKAAIASASEATAMDRSRQENGVWIAHASTTAAEAEEARFVLIAGQPLDQEVWQYGPFVLATRKDVQQTLLDFQFKRNGFENANGWESKISKRARSNSFS